MTEDALAWHERLVARLAQPGRFPHAVARVRLIQTHLSSVLLTGTYAYKIKKPLDLGFADFSTLRRRHFCCNEELRLNRRLAPALYLDVVAIHGSADEPRFAGPGPVVEYAVRMREFRQEDLADALLARGALTAAHVDAIAAAIADFQRHAPRAGRVSVYGSPRSVLAPVVENFAQLRALPLAEPVPSLLARIEAWSLAAHRRLVPRLAARLDGGQVRECHGDLHLGNIAVVDGAVQAFDCIEFNPKLRWIDVASEIAFLMMDLEARGRADFAWRFLDDWLQASGDHAVLPLLDFYLVYRAMVRAKVAALRAAQERDTQACRRALATCVAYLRYCERRIEPRQPSLIVMHGLAGAGKTTVSQALLEGMPAVRLRSDVERKRLHGLPAAALTGSPLGAGIYGEAATRDAYLELARRARLALEAGCTAIIDAAGLRRWQRELMREAARAAGVPMLVVSCEAGEATLRRRIVERARAAADASEATMAVLERQLCERDPLAGDERALHICTEDGDGARWLAEVRAALAATGPDR